MRGIHSSVLVILVLFFGSISIFVYFAMQTPYFNPFSLFLPLVTFMYIFVTKFLEWNPLVRLQNIITDSGVAGTVIGVPEYHSGNQVTYKCAFFHRYIPKEKNMKVKWLEGFSTFMSGVGVINITDHVDNFVQIKSNDCDAPEGAIHYVGKTLSNRSIPSVNSRLQGEVEYYRNKLIEIKTIFEKSKATSIASSQEQNVALSDAMLKVSTLLKDLDSGKRSFKVESGGAEVGRKY